jgi:SAM-dependent methyltransferase
MQQLTGQAYAERYGHEWNVAERAREYVERVDSGMGEREEGLRIMVSLLPFSSTSSIRLLDIGTGQGLVAALVLDAFPQATAVGLDVSEPMMEIAQERMAGYGNRFRYQLGDFVDGDLPADIGEFDVVVSSRAIHHLPLTNKKALHASILGSLKPGGCFFDLDSAAPSTDYLRARYREAGRYLRGQPIEESPERAQRPPSPGHYFVPVDDYLGSLRAAGFDSVDCFWKRLGMTLLGGYKRA